MRILLRRWLRSATALGVLIGASGCSETAAPVPIVDHTAEARALASCTVLDCRPVASRQVGSTTVRLTGAITTPCATSAVLRATAQSQGATLTVVVANNGPTTACTPSGSPLSLEVLVRTVPTSVETLVVRGAYPGGEQTLRITASIAAPN